MVYLQVKLCDPCLSALRYRLHSIYKWRYINIHFLFFPFRHSNFLINYSDTGSQLFVVKKGITHRRIQGPYQWAPVHTIGKHIDRPGRVHVVKYLCTPVNTRVV